MSRESRRHLLPWLLLMAVVQLALSWYRVRTLSTVDDYDAAWYFHVARNFAHGQGLTDITVWQFMAPPEHVIRPAGDYWSPGWPVVLGLVMKAAGDTQQASLEITAVLSMLLPVLVTLVGVETTGEMRSAVLAGWICTFTQAYAFYRVTPDVMLPYHLVVAAGLGLFLGSYRHRRPWAWLVAGGVVLGLAGAFRGEGFIPAGAALAIGLWRPPGDVSRGRAVGVLGAAVCVGLVPLMAYNIVSFGHVSPPPRSLVPWMSYYYDLYFITTQPSPARFWHEGMAHITGIMGLALTQQMYAVATCLPWPLLLLALGGTVQLWRQRSVGMRLLLLLLFLTLTVMAVVAPWVTSPGRYVFLAGWVLAIPAGQAIDRVSRRALLQSQAGRTAPAQAIMAACLVGLATFGFWPLAPFTFVWSGWQIRPAWLTDPRVAALHLTRQDVVLTDHPMQVSAYLDIPAIGCPMDQVMPVFRYRPDYIVVGTGAEEWLPRFRQEGFHGVPVQPLFSVEGTTWYHVLYATPGGRQ